MRNIEPRYCALLATMLCALASAARGQEQAQGFAVERLLQAPPGSAFVGQDDLRWPAPLSGGVSLSLGHAHAPLSIDSGNGTSLLVVRHQTTADLAFAVSWDRLRASVRFSSPVYVAGDSGTAQGRLFTGPSANLEHNPDTLSDVALSVDARLLGGETSPVRFAASATAWAPSGERQDYGTDGTWRGMVRLLAAGDHDALTWAGHVGVHFRPLDDSPTPGSPRGSEAVFGVAAAYRFDAAALPAGAALAVGPEVFGATALSAPFSSAATALEALVALRLDTKPFADSLLRIKLGAGAGLHAQFGAPAYRAVLGVELLGSAQ
jgi:hypothetical protein